jgi:hypothetical protein
MDAFSKKTAFSLPVTGIVLALASAAPAAPVTNTFAYIDSFTSGAFLSRNNFGVGAIDETYTDTAGGTLGDYAVTGRARAYAATANGQYALGARAELDAEFVPPPWGPYGSPPVFWDTAETKAIGQIQDQLTFNVPGLAAGAFMNVAFTYSLSGNGFTCDPFDCVTVYGPGEIPATEVSGEVASSIGTGFQYQTSRIDFPAPGGTFTHTFSVQNGDTQNYLLQLTARVFSTSADADAAGMASDPGYFNVHGDANYLSTLTITGLAAFDTNGAPLSGLTILNSDGVALVPTVVPEPASWAMVLAGLGLVATTVRRVRLPTAAVAG